MTQRRDLPQSPLLWVEATPAEQRVEPGHQAVFAIHVENRSAQAQSQTISIDGLAAAWVRIDFDARGLAFPQERRSGMVTISVPGDAEPGVREIAIVARAGAEQSAAAAIVDVLATEPLPLAPGVTLTPSAVAVAAGGTEARIQIGIRNVGAQDAEYQLAVSGLQAGWYRVTERLRVPGGGSGSAELWVGPPASAPEASHRFTLRVTVAETPEVFGHAPGELRVTAAEEAATPVPASAPASPPMTPTAQPPPLPAPPPAIVEEPESPVSAPDVLLAPSTSFRFTADEVTQQAIITVQNRSRILERYVIEVSGLPERWFTLTAADISLEAGDSQQVPLRLSPRPGPEHPAGEYHFRVRVSPHGYPNAATDVAAVLNVEGIESFEMRLDPPQATGRTVPYQLTLRNTGTRPIQLDTGGSDPEGRVKFRIDAAPQIEQGSEATVRVTVGARRNRFVGSPETFDFRLRSGPPDAIDQASTLDARFIHEPFLSNRLPVLAGFYGVLIAVVVFLFFWSPPHVRGFFQWTGCKVAGSGQECQSTGQRVADLDGEIVEVSVSAGDEVQKDAQLFVIESAAGGDAERYQIVATEDGRITNGYAATGDSVERGDLLLDFEQRDLPAATPTPTPTIATPGTSTPASVTSTPIMPLAATCTNDPGRKSEVPGLRVGGEAFADDRSNIRSGPLVGDNRIGQVQLDSVPEAQHLEARRMTITDGPVCGPDFTWWQVRSEFYSIDEGWVVETDGEGEVNLSPEP